MEVRIGIKHTARELAFEAEGTTDEVRAALEGGTPFVSLTDTKGKQYLIDRSSIAYAEIGTDTARRVGFVS